MADWEDTTQGSDPQRKMGRIYRRRSQPSRRSVSRQRERTDAGGSFKDTRQAPISRATPMVFTLRFFASPGQDQPSWSELSLFLSSIDHMLLLPQVQGNNPEYEYYNVDTRAYARFTGYVTDNPEDIGLDFELNLPCPHVLAMECLVLPIALAREFSLRLEYRPWAQDTDEAEPYGYANEALYSSNNPQLEPLMGVWRVACDKARHIWECVHGDSPQYRRSFLEWVWEYRNMAATLRNRYTRGTKKYLYNSPEFYQSRDDGRVFTLYDWREGKPAVFPVVDRIRLSDWPIPALNGRMIDARAFFAQGKEWLKKMAVPIKHYVTRDSLDCAKLSQLLMQMPDLAPSEYDRVPYQWVEDI